MIIMVVTKILMLCALHISATIQVSESTCSHGDVRLVNGDTVFQGRVEVCVNGTWGTVCHDGLGSHNDRYGGRLAHVVCRQLGFTNINNIKACYQACFGRGVGPIHMDDVRCTGGESHLLNCTHTNQHNCNHREDAGVSCMPQIVVPLNITIEALETSLMISWNQPEFDGPSPTPWTTYSVQCFNTLSTSYSVRVQYVLYVVNNSAFEIPIHGLQPQTTYNCCVSALYATYHNHTVCRQSTTLQSSGPTRSTSLSTAADTTTESTTTYTSSTSTSGCDTNTSLTCSSTTTENRAGSSSPSSTEVEAAAMSGDSTPSSFSCTIIGGVLGFIIIVLVVVLVLVGVVCVYLYLIRSKVKQKLQTSRATGHDLALNNPIYNGDTCPTLPVVTRGPNSLDRESNDQYSVLGPSYEIVDQSKQGHNAPPLTRNTTQQSTVTSVYEYAKFGNGNSEDDDVNPVVYEVPVKQQQDDDNGEYSKLQH